MSSSGTEETFAGQDPKRQEINLEDLGRIMMSEAGGQGEADQVAVGFTVLNRMKQHQFTDVSQVGAHRNFAHHRVAMPNTLRPAKGIIDGSIQDNSQGATNFYSPVSMPKEGEPIPSSADIGGGLESVSGVRKNGRPIQNYRPRWVQHHTPIRIPGVQDKDFKSPASDLSRTMKCALVLLFLALCFCAGHTLALASGAPEVPEWNPDDTAPNVVDVAAAAERARTTHCHTSSCTAIIVIHELVDISIYEDGDANGIAALYTGNRPMIAGRRLDRVLLDHPELFGPVCNTAAHLLSRFQIKPAVYEMYVPVQMLMHGVDMDLRNHGHCAQELAASLPKDPANDMVRLNARSACLNSDEHHFRPKAACNVLARGIRLKN